MHGIYHAYPCLPFVTPSLVLSLHQNCQTVVEIGYPIHNRIVLAVFHGYSVTECPRIAGRFELEPNAGVMVSIMAPHEDAARIASKAANANLGAIRRIKLSDFLFIVRIRFHN